VVRALLAKGKPNVYGLIVHPVDMGDRLDDLRGAVDDFFRFFLIAISACHEITIVLGAEISLVSSPTLYV
jgi:hypothetical protein